jgi:hypothetical protein
MWGFTAMVALASTPQYTYTTDFSADTNGTTDQNIGKVLFSRQPYTAEVFARNTIGLLTIKQYDGLKWEGNTSIIIYSGAVQLAILSPGQTYYFQTTGTFTMKENGNDANQAQVIVQEAEVADITVKVSGDSIFTFDYPTRVLMDATEKTINITVDIPVDAIPKSYDFNITLTSKYQNFTIKDDFRVPKNEKWEVVKNSVPTTIAVKAGDIITAGEILIDSRGNTDVNISASYTGNGTIMLKSQRDQVLFRKSSTGFGFTIQVPQQMPDGLYNQSIILSGGNITYQHNITITVKDTIPPEITKIIFKDDFLMHNNWVQVEAHDNIDVANVTVTLTSPTHNINGSYATKDNQLFTLQQIFTDPAGYNITVCAIDASNNTFCNSTTKVFQRLVLVEYQPDNRCPTRKFGKTSESLIFNVTEKVPDPITVELLDFTNDQVAVADNETNITPKAQFKISIMEGDGNTYQLNNIGEKIMVKTSGDVKLQIWGDTISEYRGILRVVVPGYARNISDISFHGRFLDYDIPNAFSREWFGKDFSCGVTDTGDLETSFYDCKVQFPISTNVEQLAVPTTVEERQLAEEQFNSTITAYQVSVQKRNIGLTILASLLIVALLILIYTAVYHPYIRLRSGGS